MPHWYTPNREDPALLPAKDELDRQLKEYGESQKYKGQTEDGTAGVLLPLSRRKIELPQFSMTPLLMDKVEPFRASFLHTLSRFFVWLLGLLWFQASVLWDKLLRRDSEQRRAERLLRIIQRVGGTLIKMGQQLAMRVDLLPYTYCVQLSKLLDRMPSFPVEEAIAAIQRATGKKLNEVFAKFDPVPIGSASIACVYQAVLRTGEQVAVKVRRPGIGRVFAADLRALGWLVGIVEWLAIVRPGNMRNMVRELETSFMEELDLRREAYLQEIFRCNSQDPKLTKRFYFTAPRVFFQYSNAEVIVQDFITGMFLWEILAAVEQGSPSALARMKELNIDPKIVGRRIAWISLWGNLSNVMFHADPHPANVIVQANNRIILIDFGACGYVPREKRNRFRELFRCQRLKNVSGMVAATMALLEPLPYIDLNAFQNDLERLYFNVQASMWSKQSPWWERTTATIWLSMLQLSRQYNLPVNNDTVKGLRATLLYDTLALRLDHDMDPIKVTNRFVRDTLDVTGRRMRRRIRKRLSSGMHLHDYAKLDELERLGNDAMERIRRLIDRPPFNFGYSIEKPVYAVITLVKVVTFLGALLLAATGSISWFLLIVKRHVSVIDVSQKVLLSTPFQILIGLTVFVGVRRIMFRLQDQDV